MRMSILWSTEPQVTIKRFSVLLFGSIGAVGVALGELARVVPYHAGRDNGARAEQRARGIIAGNISPVGRRIPFLGHSASQSTGAVLATMALAAAFFATHSKRGRIFVWGICALAVVLLVLTKSRTICGSTLVGLAAFASVGTPWAKRIVVVATALWIVWFAGLLTYLVGWDLERNVVNAVLIGRQDEAESLSGPSRYGWN